MYNCIGTARDSIRKALLCQPYEWTQANKSSIMSEVLLCSPTGHTSCTFKADEYIAEIINPRQTPSSILTDFCDGELFQTHLLFSTDPYALQIVGYYDELEIVNPIGSYVKKHKLGCLFFFLANVRPQYRSTLKAINLVAVAKQEDIIENGLDAFLRPFVEDLKSLYCDGITVCIGAEERTLCGGLIAFLADNLAAHALGGFKESMSFALRICRSCMITRPLSQECFSEDKCTLRTPETYFEQTQLLHGSLYDHYSITYGINRLSILEDVPGFTVVHGLQHDIMHDLFEGVVPYELKFLLKHCVQAKYFTINELNERIRRYDFICNKPTEIDEGVTNSLDRKIRQSASQMMTLSQELPLLIGDKIKVHDKNWDSFLLLLRICSIAISPVITPDTVAYLRILIEEKLVLFRQLYPDASIIPKLHYMIHYPAQIIRSGPLVHSWTMRQEAKLSFIKRVSQRGNFKNVCLTAAKKHQLWQCQKMQSGERILHPDIECSPKKSTFLFEELLNHVQLEIRHNNIGSRFNYCSLSQVGESSKHKVC